MLSWSCPSTAASCGTCGSSLRTGGLGSGGLGFKGLALDYMGFRIWGLGLIGGCLGLVNRLIGRVRGVQRVYGFGNLGLSVECLRVWGFRVLGFGF